jgi:hypothetical protein
MYNVCAVAKYGPIIFCNSNLAPSNVSTLKTLWISWSHRSIGPGFDRLVGGGKLSTAGGGKVKEGSIAPEVIAEGDNWVLPDIDGNDEVEVDAGALVGVVVVVEPFSEPTWPMGVIGNGANNGGGLDVILFSFPLQTPKQNNTQTQFFALLCSALSLSLSLLGSGIKFFWFVLFLVGN